MRAQLDNSIDYARKMVRLVAAETDALYAVAEAGRRALRTGDLGPLREALGGLDRASDARRSA